MQLINSIFGTPLGWIMWLCYEFIPHYGIAIILFTVITKLILVPLSIYQQKSTIKMQIYQPRITELQQKYKNNPEKMNEELQRLYKEEKFNPTAGCLPMLIQFPILFGVIDVVYRPITHILRFSNEVITKAVELAGPVLQLADGQTIEQAVQALQKNYTMQIRLIGIVKENPELFASLPDNFMQQVQNLNLTFGPLDLTVVPSLGFNVTMLIPILALVSSLAMTFFMMKQQGNMNTGGDASQQSAANASKGMMWMMPVVSTWISMSVPSGVGLYWIVGNVFSIIQSAILAKVMNPKEALEKAKQEAAERAEQAKLERQEAKRRAKEEQGELSAAGMTQKEINRQKLAAARKRDAEKYGETYKEVSDDDLK